jgi:hypothetical protein
MSLPKKSTSLAEVLTPGQTVADCINHCGRSSQELSCIQLLRVTLGLALCPTVHVILGTDITREHKQFQMLIILIRLAAVLDSIVQTISFRRMYHNFYYPVANSCRFR